MQDAIITGQIVKVIATIATTELFLLPTKGIKFHHPSSAENEDYQNGIYIMFAVLK